jgi:Zn-dependent protease
MEMFFVFQIVVLIFSVVFHEVSHGMVANAMGDTTAKNAGRLTLNPIPHIDPIGSVALPLFLIIVSQLSGGAGFIIGWAKPVPVNPRLLKDQKWGSAKVSLAGPAANLALAVVFGLALRFLPIGMIAEPLVLLFSFIVYINILLALFNLLPIPPLDGSHILFSVLPRSLHSVKVLLAQYGFLLLMVFIFFFFGILSFFVNHLFSFITGFSVF